MQRCYQTITERDWDYRSTRPPRAYRTSNAQHRDDGAVMVMFGDHVLMNTLIRCTFSLASTTGQRFVLTGCAQGNVVGERRVCRRPRDLRAAVRSI